MSVPSTARGRRISLGQLHLGQSKAHWALLPYRFKALRCGRRFGKTEFAKNWIAQGLVQGEEVAWFAPQHMTWSEVYFDLAQMLQPILDTSSRTPPVIRLSNSGRIDFWSLENAIAGRGRRYRRIVIDEAAFTKDGDNRSEDSMRCPSRRSSMRIAWALARIGRAPVLASFAAWMTSRFLYGRPALLWSP